MSARHALLGLLLDRPGYPYQLADRLEERLGPTWKLNSGQLYQTIAGLVGDGLIERVGGATDDAEDRRRHIYAITKTGALEYEHWFGRVTKPGRISRRPLLLKIMLASPERSRKTLEEIDAYERDCIEVVTEISRRRDAGPPEHWTWVDRVIFRLSLNADISQAEGELRWAREARAEVSLLAQEGVSSGRRIAERQH